MDAEKALAQKNCSYQKTCGPCPCRILAWGVDARHYCPSPAAAAALACCLRAIVLVSRSRLARAVVPACCLVRWLCACTCACVCVFLAVALGLSSAATRGAQRADVLAAGRAG